MRTLVQRKLISDKCNEAIQKKKKQKMYVGSLAPYGYIIDKKTRNLIIDKNVSHVIFLIFDLYDKGYGLTYIANYLNERGIVIPSQYRKIGKYIYRKIDGYSNKWEKSSVRKILNNRVYNGFYNYSTEKTHKEIIDDELWEKVALRLKEQKNIIGNNFFDINGNEFSNKVICSVCNHNFTIENSRCKEGIVRYLRCSCYDKRKNQKYECSNKNAIRYDDLKDIVSFFLEEKIFNNMNYNDLLLSYEHLLNNQNFDIKRNYIKQEKHVLNDLYLSNLNELGTIDNEIINQIKINQINAENLVIKNRIEELEKYQKELYKMTRTYKVSKDYIKLDKVLIDNFIDKIYIGEMINYKRDISIIIK